MRILGCAALVCALSAVVLPSAAGAHQDPAAVAARKALTIRPGRYGVKQLGAFRPGRRATIAAAARAFGHPSSRRPEGDTACIATWRRLRLRIVFANFGGNPPGKTACSGSVGMAQSFVSKGRRFRTWKGLRVGQRQSQVRHRHPSAKRHHHTWWLRTASSPFGDGSHYAVVSAHIGPHGRVASLAGWIGAAGD